MKRDLPDLEAVARFGARIAAALRPGDVVALSGGLGAGKTTLARAIIAALGHEGEVPSPSFAIVELYDPPMVRLPLVHADFYRLTRPEDAEELCQDTFVRAFSALPRYQNEDRFAAWLFRIARNRCHDYHRSRSRREAERTRSLERGEHEPLVSPVPGPDEKISGREDLAKLRRAIAALPERLREVLVLCGLEEMSHEECAVLLGCSRRAVEGRLYRARLELADALERDRT